MAVARPILAFASIILVAGACLLILLTILGGAVDHSPTNKFYFLQADTSGIAGAPDVARWTFWNACPSNNGKNDCGKVHPAFPLNPGANFDGPDANIPSGFIGTKKYYYLTRFMFAFVLIGLFFAALSLTLGLLALCSKIVSYLDGAIVSVALFFQTLTSALMTAAYVKGRDVFRGAGRDASLGKYNFGFMWAAVACLFLATVFLCGGGAASKSSGRKSGGGRFGFGRKKSTRRDRGSFIDRSSFEKSERPLPLTNGA